MFLLSQGAAQEEGPPPDEGGSQLRLLASGPGSIVIDSLDVVCDGDCIVPAPPGTSLLARAVPEDDESFFGWRGACNGEDDCVVLPGRADTLTAVFGDHVVAVDVEGSGEGTILLSPPNLRCTDDCAAGFERPLQVSITIIPEESAVRSWGGACAETTGNYCLVSVEGITEVSVDLVSAPTPAPRTSPASPTPPPSVSPAPTEPTPPPFIPPTEPAPPSNGGPPSEEPTPPSGPTEPTPPPPTDGNGDGDGNGGQPGDDGNGNGGDNGNGNGNGYGNGDEDNGNGNGNSGDNGDEDNGDDEDNGNGNGDDDGDDNGTGGDGDDNGDTGNGDDGTDDDGNGEAPPAEEPSDDEETDTEVGGVIIEREDREDDESTDPTDGGTDEVDTEVLGVSQERRTGERLPVTGVNGLVLALIGSATITLGTVALKRRRPEVDSN